MMNSGIKRIASGIVLGCAVLMLLLTSCGAGEKSAHKSVSVSFGPQAYLLKNIVGDRYAVNTILPPGTDPETYDPTVGDLMALSGSKAYFTLSTPGFEKNVIEKVASNFPGVRISDVSAGIDRIAGTHGDEGDPHLWSSVGNARRIASSMLEEMCVIDPDGSVYYRHRADSLDRVLVALDSAITADLKASGAGVFVMQHPSLSYFARDYGLRQIALETEGKEASPRQMADRIKQASESGADVLFYENEHNPDQAKAVAGMLGIKAVGIFLNTEKWPEEMLKISRSF